MKKIQKTPVNIKLRSFWAVVFTMVAFVMLVLTVQAQQIKIGSGVHFVNGTNVVVNGDSIVNQGTLRNKATGVIKLTGNWQNDGTCSSEKGSVVNLAGSAVQVIGGSNPTVFGTLRLNNSAGFSLAQQTTVNGNLDFQNGMLATGNYLITIGDTGTITHASATKYVDGKLAMTFSTLGTKAFPIGKGGNYRPVTLQYTGLTGTSIVTAEQFETGLSGTLPENTTLLTTGRHWAISQSGGSSMQYFVTIDADGYTPVRPVVMLKQNAGVINDYPTTAPDYTNTTAFTTFSDFGLGESCINPTSGGIIAGNQNSCTGFDPAEITNITLPSGNTGTLIYRWQESVTDSVSGFSAIAGATDITYNPPAISQTTWYRRIARVDCKPDWTAAISSNVVEKNIYPVFTTGAIKTTGDTICFGGDPDPIGNDTVATGGHGTIFYQWQKSTDNLDFSHIGGATSANYDPPSGLTITTWYRRQAKEETCSTTFTNSGGVWKVLVNPTSVGGAVTGGTLVCYGLNSTLLTLSGQTGDVQKWQYSTNDTVWNDIPGTTSTTYTATNLTVKTWFRAVVASGICTNVNSSSTAITIFSNYKISGYAKYENNPQTPLNGLKVLLRKGSAVVDSVVTTTAGYYEFDNLTNGDFGLAIKSSHPSGQWQTWGGVNNTDYLLVSKHITGTQYLPVNPPVVQTSASVKLPHPAINTLDANAIRQAAKFPATGYTFFDTTKWVFSGIDASNALNDITLSCANVTRDIRGLCSGDVNGTYVPPTGNKTAVETLHATSLQLEHLGNLPLTDEMAFPIRAGHDMELGAITLMLDYDPSRIEITGVSMPENGGVEPWFVVETGLKPVSTNGILHTGWMSLNPINVTAGQTVLLIRARLTEACRTSHITPQISHSASENANLKSELRNLKSEIRFSLNESPLSELADGDGNVLQDARLSIADAGFKVQSSRFNEGPSVVVYPNPVKDVLNVEFVVNNVDGKTGHGMSLQLVTMHGVVVAKQNVADIKAGMNKTTMDLRDLPNGAYLLKVNYEDQVVVRKVIVNR